MSKISVNTGDHSVVTGLVEILRTMILVLLLITDIGANIEHTVEMTMFLIKILMLVLILELIVQPPAGDVYRLLKLMLILMHVLILLSRAHANRVYSKYPGKCPYNLQD